MLIVLFYPARVLVILVNGHTNGTV